MTRNFDLVRLFVVLVCAGVLAPLTAAAQAVLSDYQWYIVNEAQTFEVMISDDVDDGCWTNTQRSSTKASLQLIRSGFDAREVEAGEATGVFPAILLSAVGYATNDYSCVVSAEVSVIVLDWGTVGDAPNELTALFNRELWSQTFILSGPKSSMSDRIADVHEQLVESFLVQLASEVKDFEKSVLETLSDDPGALSHWREKFAD